jgi:hypothetical protein
MTEIKPMTNDEIESVDFFKKDWVKPYVTIPVGATYYKKTYDKVTIEFAVFNGSVYLIDLFKDGESPNSNRQEIFE